VASGRLMDLSKRLTDAQGQLFALEAEYHIVERGNYDSLPAVLHSPLIQNLRENYDRLEVEHALLALKFRPTYPPLRQLSGQLDHAHKLLDQETGKVVKGVEAKYQASQATVEQLKNELEGQRKALLARKDVEGEFLALTSDVETTKALHDNLLARIKDLNVAGQSSLSNVTVVDPAAPPLLLGNGSMPPTAEAYRTLRTALLLSRAISPRVILVSSATGAEGKTTTAVNMAAALATCGAKVLLIDADLRQPRCHSTLGVKPSPGLSDFLTGRVTTEPIQTTRVENL